jgi:hypothetical protein
MTAQSEASTAVEASAFSTSALKDGTSVIVESVFGMTRFYRFFHIESVVPPALTLYKVGGSSNKGIHNALLSHGLTEEFLEKLITRGRNPFPHQVLRSTLTQFGQSEDSMAKYFNELCEILDNEYVSLYFYPRGATAPFRYIDVHIVINYMEAPGSTA